MTLVRIHPWSTMIELHPVCSLLPELLPSDSKYFEMSLFENDLDRKINHKQLQIADASFKITKAKRNLLVFISHQISDENGENISSSSDPSLFSSSKSWTVRIEGKLEGYGRKINKKFTTFFKKIIVDINNGNDLIECNLSPLAITDSHQLQNQSQVEGQNSSSPSFLFKGMENESFEIKRKFPSDDSNPINLKIFLYPNHQTDRFKLSDPLALLLDTKIASRPQIIVSLWKYIKIHKLQESDEKKSIVNDESLKMLFGVDKMSFTDLPALIEPHLLPEEPFMINYSIPPFTCLESRKNVNEGVAASSINTNSLINNENRNANANETGKNEQNSIVIENLEIELEDTTRAKTANQTIISLTREIGALDQKMIEVSNALKHAKATIKVLEEFSKDPREWLLQALKRQAKDYQIILGDASINIEDARQSEYYSDYWDLVKIYSKLNK